METSLAKLSKSSAEPPAKPSAVFRTKRVLHLFSKKENRLKPHPGSALEMALGFQSAGPWNPPMRAGDWI